MTTEAHTIGLFQTKDRAEHAPPSPSIRSRIEELHTLHAGFNDLLDSIDDATRLARAETFVERYQELDTIVRNSVLKKAQLGMLLHNTQLSDKWELVQRTYSALASSGILSI